MRIILAAAAFAAVSGSSAFALSTDQHHGFCLQTESAQECAYDSVAQCLAAKRGNSDFCIQNSEPVNHPLSE
jgi:hypothetical protein